LSDYQLPPGLADIDPPPLWEMGAARFEGLGRALLEEQLGIASCEQYGMPGQTQWGIDLLADYSNGGGHQAGQCKCHQDFTSQDIKAAVDEFLAHWESRWRERGVKVFVLMVACDLKEVRTRERILTEKRRLGALGIVFQVWSRRTLLQKLMPFPGLVAAHFGRGHYWIERITGRTQPTFQPTSPASFGPGGAAADGELQWLLDHATAGLA
jgi:hypothetical protein